MARLADKEFWETDYYWADVAPPWRIDPAVAFDRSVAGEMTRNAPVADGASVLEIGCAPAKWLVFYAEQFGAAVRGIEYSHKGAEISRANLEACGVKGEIIEADFFDEAFEPADLVLSFGFIEHFTDLDDVFARHVACMKAGGRMALLVPNFRGANRWLQQMGDPQYLARHNRAAMVPGLYRRLAREHGLLLQRLAFVGGFDPSIIRLRTTGSRLDPRRLVPGLVTSAERRFRATAAGERVNSPLLSSCLVAFFDRPAAGPSRDGLRASGPQR